MYHTPFNFPLTGGLDRNASPVKADKASFYTMANMRQANDQRGVIEQVPRYYSRGVLTQGTYWDGVGSATEPTGSAVRYWDDTTQIRITDFCIWYASTTQMKIFEQVAVPTTAGVTGGCLFTVENIAATTVTLGSTYDVEIDGVATFRWRVNGGAWTSLVAIDQANGNLIDSNSVRLYWLAATGFTPTDTWSWKRTDYSDLGTAPSNPPRILQVNDKLYYAASNNELVYVVDMTKKYARTVGYRAVGGTFVTFFENHLFVFGAVDYDWRSSDLNNFDNFIPTDTNEADFGDLPMTQEASALTNSTPLDAGVFQNRLYVLTSGGFFYTDYLGQPVVFSFKQINSLRSTSTSASYMKVTHLGIFVTTPSQLFQFEGSFLTPLMTYTPITIAAAGGLIFNDKTSELIIKFASILIVYQVAYRTAYTRSCLFAGGTPTGWSISSDGLLQLGTGSRTMLTEDEAFAFTPVMDAGNGASFAVPTLVTQFIGGDTIDKRKETQDVSFAAAVGTSGSAYSHTANLQLVLGYYSSDAGVITGSATAVDSWVNTAPEMCFNALRVHYKLIALQLTLVGLTMGKPPAAFSLRALNTPIYLPAGSQPVR